MHTSRALPDAPGSVYLKRLTWLPASYLTAALAHAAIASIGAGGRSAEAWAGRGHGAFAPIALAAFGILIALLLRSALQTARPAVPSYASDPLTILARRFASTAPLLPCLYVALGGLMTLLGMEFREQLGAFGRGDAEMCRAEARAAASAHVHARFSRALFGSTRATSAARITRAFRV